MRVTARHVSRFVLAVVGYGIVAAIAYAPMAAEQSIEDVRFEDRLGTLPVEVGLAHNGVSTLDTGILGELFWKRTGLAGFGATVRATGPPVAGGSLSSYVSPDFVQANAQFVNEPDEVAKAYGSEMQTQVVSAMLWAELGAGLLGGVILAVVFRGRAPWQRSGWTRRRRRSIGVLCVATALLGSSLAAQQQFEGWSGNGPIAASYPMPGIDELSFSSPEALEIARQVQPFITKNTDRIRERTKAYLAAAETSLRAELPPVSGDLAPRSGERIVVAEADPQGSLVGTDVRRVLYPLLEEYLGEDALVLRTISGDVTSNGTIAEEGFVADEVAAGGDIPTVAVKGDHDSTSTVEQLEENDVVVPDLETAEVDGLKVAGGNDPAFKALFGGLVTNPSGVTEAELGEKLRDELDPDEPVIILLHQPRAAVGYLGIHSTSELASGLGRETTPWDDGIPDVPPGTVNVGHLHDVSGPWVIWNTDGDEVTWTVVSQLGTAGGVEENPTFNRFSTPFSVPLKNVSVQLQFINTETGLQTGYAELDIAVDGTATIGERVDVGLPGGEPLPIEDVVLASRTG